MTYQIKTDSFTINANTKEEAFNYLLRLNGLNISSFSSYMNVSEDEAKKAPLWAINYLKDIANAEFIHLGYIMKDTKTSGLIVEYKKLQSQVQEAITNNTISGSQPIILNEDIISEAGSIKARYITHTEDILKDFLQSK